MEEQKLRKKSLSPKLQLKRLAAMLPVDLYDWLKEKAEREHKSLSFLLTELLTEAKQKEEIKAG
jgi:hypothetical protein